MNDLTYCIVPAPATDARYEAAIESSTTARVSLDGTLCILKWRGAIPAAFDGLATMNHAEAIAEMQTAAWQDPAGTP
jgi:hypothetical protein